LTDGLPKCGWESPDLKYGALHRMSRVCRIGRLIKAMGSMAPFHKESLTGTKTTAT